MSRTRLWLIPAPEYIYVTNALDNSVTAYAINLRSGTADRGD